MTDFLAFGFSSLDDTGFFTALVVAAVRIVLGGFFFVSGFHKLFNTDRHRMLVDTLRGLGFRHVCLMSWWVAGWEFLAGLLLVLGLFTIPAAGVLFIICVVACLTDGVQRVQSYQPIDLADAFDDWMYLPETLYCVLLLLFLMTGGGPFSLDTLLFI